MEDFRASQERQSEGFFPTTPSKNRHVSGKSAVLKATVKHQIPDHETPDQIKLGPTKFRHFAESYI